MNVYLLLIMLVVAVILFLYLMPARMELFSLGSTSPHNRDNSLSNKGKRNILRVVEAPMLKRDRMGRVVYHINLSQVSNYHNISDMKVTTPIQSVTLKWNGYPLYQSNGDLPTEFIPIEYMSPYPVTLEVTALEEPGISFTLYQKELPASSNRKLVATNFTFANSNYRITDGMVTRLT